VQEVAQLEEVNETFEQMEKGSVDARFVFDLHR
jgi:D-arabinose 1-dehydrogenase-like Zn-dependent alcohol dehydrogenase